MRLGLRAVVPLLILLSGCASTPPRATTPATASTSASVSPSSATSGARAETPAASLADHLGDSTATAVTVPADAPEEGVPFENNWIFDRFGRFRKIGGGTGQQDGRRFDVVKFELPDHSEHTVYFDITENWRLWAPPH
jgi:hypothetical protein